jgi:hypothetical protein
MVRAPAMRSRNMLLRLDGLAFLGIGTTILVNVRARGKRAER